MKMDRGKNVKKERERRNGWDGGGRTKGIKEGRK